MIRFRQFELDTLGRRLCAGGMPIALGSRAFDVLAALAERPGRLVTKEELLRLVWAPLVVEESNLAVHVSTLRKVLGPGAIETVPGSGYRFLETIENPASPPAPSRGNLPRQTTSFVDREHELATARTLLVGATRLLTMTGGGGLGKTRMALRLAIDVVPEYPDGAWWVELGPLSDGHGVPQAVASALRVVELADRPLVDSLVTHVRGERRLIVLDNCEHVLTATAALVRRLLEAAPGLRIVATSREALHVIGETTLSIAPLPVPPIDGKRGPDTDPAPSVRLFVDRAKAVIEEFELSPRNEASVARICRQLDGIPLAVELAAARARVLSVDAIAERLNDRFTLLTTGPRFAPQRQQTLRATLEWSYDLLSPEEQRLFCRLAVFAGGCTLASVEAVCASDAGEPGQVVDLLTSLVDKSLVTYIAAADRYSMLETVRHFALERLETSGEALAARQRHFAHFLEVARQADNGLKGADADEWLKRLGHERENLLAAHAHCTSANGSALSGLELLDATRLWWTRHSPETGARVCAEALALPAAAAHTRERSLGLYAGAALAYYRGEYAQAQAYAAESLSIAREIGDVGKTVDALVVLGLARVTLGDRISAREALLEAVAITRQLDDVTRRGDAVGNLAEVYSVDGDDALALPLYEEALALATSRCSAEAIVVNLFNLARTHVALGRSREARGYLRTAIGHMSASNPDRSGQLMLAVAAGLAGIAKQWARAARYLGAAEADLVARNASREPAEAVFLAILPAQARVALTEEGYGAAETAGRTLGIAQAADEILEWLNEASS